MILTAVHRDWDAPVKASGMGDGRIAVTNRSVTRDGRPIFPISGELHPTRVPRTTWPRRLRAMRNGGITVVAAYVFWLHHQPEADSPPDFTGDRDIAAFVRLCAEVGLDVVLRIGPWCHGEVRNGGFPDWVQAAPVRHRTNDPGYLALADGWYRALAQHLEGCFDAGGPVLGIQLENELYDQPEHIAELKRMAMRAGMSAPLWMSTAWGGAQLPAHEVLPMYGGYADGFWVDHDQPWDETFREHFLFSHVWDDPGIGADVRAVTGGESGSDRISPSEEFPPVTCELGGGMATAYHRRPVLSAEDIAAVANAKLGNGSAWQGYYMYAGGRNPAPGLQESQATGYPNDLPQIDYDFHAPIGAAGRLTRTHALLRQQHAFLAAVGADLVDMPSTLPEVRPAGVHDGETVRWAVRSDGERGFVFVNRHQPYEQLHDSEPVTFRIELPSGAVEFPDHPVSIPAGTIARFPFGLPVGETTLDWATASLLTLLPRDGGGTIAVFAACPGIPPRLSFGGLVASGDVLEVGRDAVVVLPADIAETTWMIDGVLYSSTDEFDVDGGEIITWARHGAPVARFDTAALRFETLTASEASAPARCLTVTQTTDAAAPAVSYGERDGRAAAPSPERVRADGAMFAVALPAEWRDREIELTVSWTGDVALAEADGALLGDRFWDGTAWTLLVPPGTAALTLRIVPLHPDAPVWIDPRFPQRGVAEVAEVTARLVERVVHR